MAEIDYNLRKPIAEAKKPINVIIRYEGQKLVYSSGKKIIPRYWDIINQKARWVFRSDGASDFGQTVPLKRSYIYIKKLGLFLFQYSFSQGLYLASKFEAHPTQIIESKKQF